MENKTESNPISESASAVQTVGWEAELYPVIWEIQEERLEAMFLKSQRDPEVLLEQYKQDLNEVVDLDNESQANMLERGKINWIPKSMWYPKHD